MQIALNSNNKLYELNSLKIEETNNTYIEKAINVMTEKEKLMKAKSLNDEYVRKCNCMNTNDTKSNPYFFLDIEGNIYLCAWKLTKPIGNIFKDEIEDVLDVMNSPFNKKILVGKIEEAFSLEKGNVEEYKNIQKNMANVCYAKNLERTIDDTLFDEKVKGSFYFTPSIACKIINLCYNIFKIFFLRSIIWQQ